MTIEILLHLFLPIVTTCTDISNNMAFCQASINTDPLKYYNSTDILIMDDCAGNGS